VDSDTSVKTHVSKTTSCCFNALRQIRSIRRSVSKPVLLSLATSLVLTCLDYGSTNLTGISGRLLDRLQSVLNAAARLVVMVKSATTSRLCSVTYIGFDFHSVSRFIWPFLFTVVETTQHPSTCQETCSGQQTVTPGNDYGHHQCTS